MTPFALSENDLTVYTRDGFDYLVYHDPGPPPYLGTPEGDALYKEGFEQVVEWSGFLDPVDGVMIDVSPASLGNNTLGTNDGDGYDVNPATGEPYAPQMVPAGDYYRILAEFWADGPDSETPPGHWFTIANYVSDHPDTVKRFGGQGSVLDDLEWDVKLYLALGGAMHDVAIAAWGVKGWYDYVRPISAIRYMAGKGQCSDPQGLSYHKDGINLRPGFVEVVTEESAQPGSDHDLPIGLQPNASERVQRRSNAASHRVHPRHNVSGTRHHLLTPLHVDRLPRTGWRSCPVGRSGVDDDRYRHRYRRCTREPSQAHTTKEHG